ncbi:MAG: glycerol kinase, partial [Pseudomonadota bacterium]|nr:glycerol kinase [Pseudomonadota bacterium]
MTRFVLALDQGTTSSRSILFDHAGAIVATAQREFTQHFPRSGWVEHDAEEIWATQAATIAEVLARARATVDDLVAVGITNQRETTVLWDRATGRPVAPAIVWQDRRTADFCARLKADGHEPEITRRTGLLLDPYFSGTKLAWLLDSDPQLRARAERGELAFGTIDSWLAWKLSRGAQHITDASNASRTLLLDIATGDWDDYALDLLRIPRALLPRVVPSSLARGEAFALLGGREVPLGGIAGDQQAALFGQACFTPGMAKNTYGTGCFMLMNTGRVPQASANRLLTTVAWHLDVRHYALEGAVFVGGAVVQWLRDGLGFIEKSSEVEALAATVPDAGGMYLVPAFTGLGSPHWDAFARGTMVGLSRGTTKA